MFTIREGSSHAKQTGPGQVPVRASRTPPANAPVEEQSEGSSLKLLTCPRLFSGCFYKLGVLFLWVSLELEPDHLGSILG